MIALILFIQFPGVPLLNSLARKLELSLATLPCTFITLPVSEAKGQEEKNMVNSLPVQHFIFWGSSPIHLPRCTSQSSQIASASCILARLHWERPGGKC